MSGFCKQGHYSHKRQRTTFQDGNNLAKSQLDLQDVEGGWGAVFVLPTCRICMWYSSRVKVRRIVTTGHQQQGEDWIHVVVHYN